MRFANLLDDSRGSACARLAYFDLDPAKRGGLLDLPFPDAERTGELTHGQRTGVPAKDALNAGETFAA